MLLRQTIQSVERRISVGLVLLLIGIGLDRFGPRLSGLADRPLADGLIDGFSVVLIALGLLLSVSGAATRARRRGSRA